MTAQDLTASSPVFLTAWSFCASSSKAEVLKFQYVPKLQQFFNPSPSTERTLQEVFNGLTHY